MNRRRGSAIVMSMLLLVILSALGMYVVSAPRGTGDGAGRHYRAAAARNMARAGAHAAIARFPGVIPGGSPYVRLFPLGSGMTGRYSVTSRTSDVENRPGQGTGIVLFDVASVGSVSGVPDDTVRVAATVRYGPERGAPGARIVKWVESEPR